MNAVLFKIAVIFLLVAGEALAIYSETIAAKTYSVASQNFFVVFTQGFIVITCAGVLIIYGYMISYRIFNNIWVVNALSLTSILIAEPLIGYIVFQQLPTRGAFIGLILGTLGFISVLIL